MLSRNRGGGQRRTCWSISQVNAKIRPLCEFGGIGKNRGRCANGLRVDHVTPSVRSRSPMKCPKCATEVQIEAVYCPACGARLDEVADARPLSDSTAEGKQNFNQ